VLHVDGPAKALLLLDDRPEVNLLLTDVVMPEMNGRHLAEKALRRHADLKVLYFTGFTRNAIVHNGMLDPGVQLLTKPFTIEQLAKKVREVLGPR
jgi:CheY-like chemotaxis protein